MAPTICLNMIVKNESKIILRLLNSVVLLIDSYCICDTGSTDNTIELITSFFKDKGIIGKVIEEPFQDFGYNRTFALNSCQDIINSDYLLFLDADMIFWMNPKINISDLKKKLIHDAYYINQGNDIFHYKNIRIVKNRQNFSYWGVTHEYVNCPDNMMIDKIEKDDLFIIDIGDGGCKDDKISRDIRLLTKGLKELPNNDRYTFYLANSYQNQGDLIKAIEFYKKRIDIGGWIEEIWLSHYSIGKCYKNLDNIEYAIFHWLEAYNKYPRRIENLYEIIHHYREKGNNDLAYNFYNLANYERINNPIWDYLFTEVDIYDYKIDYEMTIIGYYCNRDNFDLKQISMKVLKNPNSNDSMKKNVLSNYKFYCCSILENEIKISDYNIEIMKNIGKSLCNNDFVSSTPTICLGNNKDQLIINIRYVNYKIDEFGNYINQNHIISKNIIAIINTSLQKWSLEYESILEYDESIDDYYIGLEDIRYQRLIDKNNIVTHTYNANRCNKDGNIKVEHGTIDMNSKLKKCLNSQILTKNGERHIEKNWVLFDNKGIEQCIYEWSPLTIGNININGNLDISNINSNVPSFFKDLRGSSNGIIINDEIWFICHIVSYEERRYYYHIVVVLDINTFALKSYTNLWTFEKKPVEYTLSILYFQNKFLIGYSIMDKETKYTTISKHIFDNMMIKYNNII
jgi:tetratricopeptide (TPR) repeat protein